MSDPPHDPSAAWSNPLRLRWARLCIGFALFAAAVLGSALGYLLLAQPRLLTWAEIVPPDESLVSVLLFPAVLLAVLTVLLARLRRVPAQLIASPAGLRWRVGVLWPRPEVPWTDVHVAPTGGPWEGTPLDIRGEGERGTRLWVDPKLAEEVRLRKGSRDAPERRRGPQR